MLQCLSGMNYSGCDFSLKPAHMSSKNMWISLFVGLGAKCLCWSWSWAPRASSLCSPGSSWGSRRGDRWQQTRLLGVSALRREAAGWDFHQQWCLQPCSPWCSEETISVQNESLLGVVAPIRRAHSSLVLPACALRSPLLNSFI